MPKSTVRAFPFWEADFTGAVVIRYPDVLLADRGVNAACMERCCPAHLMEFEIPHGVAAYVSPMWNVADGAAVPACATVKGSNHGAAGA